MGAVLIPFAAAALIVIALSLGYMLSAARSEAPIVVYVKDPLLEAAQERHVWCSREEHVFHRDADLPDDLGEIASRLGAELGIRVQAPSLRKWGFDLLGAKRCRVAGVPVAHLLYFASRDSIMLSIFSMYRIRGLEVASEDDASMHYFALSANGPKTLAWHEGPQTYVACAPISDHELLAVGEFLRGRGDRAAVPLGREAIASATRR